MSDVYSCDCVSINVLLSGEQFCKETAHFFRSGCSGLILPDCSRLCNAANLQNPVHIIGENCRYIEPFLAEREAGCQGGGSYKDTL